MRSSSPWPSWICKTYFMVSRFTSPVVEGNYYNFTSLKVRKDTFNNSIHLNTAKTGCVILEAPVVLLSCFALLTYSLGNKQQRPIISCCNCNKMTTSIETKIVQCPSGGLKQRPAFCKKHQYLQGLFQHDKGTIHLTFFDATLKQILGPDVDTVFQACKLLCWWTIKCNVVISFLSLPKVLINFHKAMGTVFKPCVNEL